MNNLGEIKEKINKTSDKILGSKYESKPLTYYWHNYWSRKPPEIASLLVSELCSDNMIFCDPFMGSGIHVIEAIRAKDNIKAIGVEVNELPIKIALSTIESNFKQEEIASEFTYILNKLKKKYNIFYTTYCPKCNKKVEYERGILSEKEEGYTLEKIKITCPNCGKKEYIEASNKNKKLFKYYNKKAKKIYTDDLVLDYNPRIAVKKGMRISTLFTPRNYLIINKIKQEIMNLSNTNVRKNLLLTLSSMIHLSKLTDLRSQSQFPYWKPTKNILERNLFMLLEKRFHKFIKHKKKSSEYIDKQVKIVKKYNELVKNKNSVLLLNKPIQKINEQIIPNDSIDLIITDPPYYDQVAYSEYLKLWEFFTEFRTNLEDEIVVTQRTKGPKNHEYYFKELKKAFRNIYRILKKNGYLIVYFNDSKISVWVDFLGMMNSLGFYFIKQLHITKQSNTYKQNNSPRGTLKGECLLFFYKAYNKCRKIHQYKKTDKILEVNNIIQNHLINLFKEKDHPLTTAKIYNSGLIHRLYQKGLLELASRQSGSLLQLIENYARFDPQRNGWILKNNGQAKD